MHWHASLFGGGGKALGYGCHRAYPSAPAVLNNVSTAMARIAWKPYVRFTVLLLQFRGVDQMDQPFADRRLCGLHYACVMSFTFVLPAGY